MAWQRGNPARGAVGALDRPQARLCREGWIHREAYQLDRSKILPVQLNSTDFMGTPHINQGVGCYVCPFNKKPTFPRLKN